MYRLALDVGTNSLGWAVVTLDPETGEASSLRDMGVRIFSDGRVPKTGIPLASQRTLKRRSRITRERKNLRKKDLLKLLKRSSLLPQSAADNEVLKISNPYDLRAHGLDRKLSLHQFGRALFHLHQSRGFASSADPLKADEEGAIRLAVEATRQEMIRRVARTYGELLFKRRLSGERVRALIGEGGLYPSREVIRDEFDQFYDAQAKHHPELTPELKARLTAVIFRQRPLKPVACGDCTLELQEPRCPRALMEFQTFRILQDLAHLRVGSEGRSLTTPEKGTLLNILEHSSLTFAQVREALGLKKRERLNYEGAVKAGLKGNETNIALSEEISDGWDRLAYETRSEIVRTLLVGGTDFERFGMALDDIKTIGKVPLPKGYGKVSLKAIHKLTPHLYTATSFYGACQAAGYKEPERQELSKLPYYGSIPTLRTHLQKVLPGSGSANEQQYGRIGNPTVHIALNQIRKVVNKVVDAYGPPSEIAVELVRDLRMSDVKKAKRDKQEREKEKENERMREDFKRLSCIDSNQNRLKWRLWNTLPEDERVCLYMNIPITVEMALSSATETDHIIPYAKSLDNGMHNLVICMMSANRAKRKRTPREAFEHLPGYDWSSIVARAERFAKHSNKRVASAWSKKLSRILGEEPDDFLERHLNDTSYLAKITLQYLEGLVPSGKAYATKGPLTGMLRGRWGLNKKREDHRHHAVDAAVIGCTTRSLIQKLSRAAETSRNSHLDNVPLPWDLFVHEVDARFATIVVSHKRDHGTGGSIFKDTVYGYDEVTKGIVTRKPLEDLNENEVKRVRDSSLRHKLLECVREGCGEGLVPKTLLKKRLVDFGQKTGIRRVRLVNVKTAVEFKDRNGVRRMLESGENYCMDVFAQGETWTTNVKPLYVSVRDAGVQPNNGQFLFRLHKGDSLKIGETVWQVVGLKSDGRLKLKVHTDAAENTVREPNIKKLRKENAFPVYVDEIGRVHRWAAPARPSRSLTF